MFDFVEVGSGQVMKNVGIVERFLVNKMKLWRPGDLLLGYCGGLK